MRQASTAELFYTDVGHGQNVMLLHGWTCDSHDWSWQLPLWERRYRVLAVDLRGHGRSEAMPSGGYQLADFVADLEALAAGTFSGERFTIVGHSLGGQIAALMAVRRPEHVAAIVSVDGSLGIPSEMASLLAKTAQDLALGDPATVVPAFVGMLYDGATAPALKRWHARRAEGMPPHVVRESFGPQFVGPDQVGVGRRSEDFCRTITVPVYHLCRDPAQAGRMRPWFSHPRSRVDVWHRAGHWIMQDRPDEVSAAITAWLETLD